MIHLYIRHRAIYLFVYNVTECYKKYASYYYYYLFFIPDFNQDGKPDNISFMIKRVKVHSNPDPSYKFMGNYGVEKFLEIFSGKSKLIVLL